MTSREELVRSIHGAAFRPVRLRAGFDMAEVDDLLDRLAAAVETGGDVAGVIDGARFTVVRLREGYDMVEVDRFLASVRSAATGSPEPAPERTGPVAPVGTPYDSVVAEQRGLLSRLFGRR